MAAWKQTTIGDFCPFLYGKGLPEKSRRPGAIPVVSSAGITGAHEMALVNTGGIVIGRKGTVGSLTLVKQPFWPIDTAFYIPDEPEKRDLRFTFYLLKTLNLNKMNSDSAVPGLNRDNAHQRKIVVPELIEQRAIAKVLGELDNKIELNRQMNETLEATARALFKSWFVDFDPVRAKLEGRAPDGISADIAALFPDDFSNGIPKGWSEDSIYSCAEFINGAAYKNMHFTSAEGALPVIKIAELKSGVDQGTKFTNTDLGSKYSINTGELLFSWSGSPETSIDTFLWVGGKAWLNQHIFKVVTDSVEMRTFVFFLLKHLKPIFISTAKDKQTTGLGHITVQDLKRLETVYPDKKVLKAFSDIARPLLERIQTNMEQIVHLHKIRDALLPKLISGELRVGDADALKEAV